MKPATALLVMLPLIAVVTAFVLVGTRGAGAGPQTDGVWWDEQVAGFVRRRVAQSYVDELDEERGADAFYRAMDAYVKGLDEYCDFISPEEHRKWRESTTGEYAGLGVKVREMEDGLLVLGVLPGGPAATAGIQPGDTMTHAGGVPLAQVGMEEIEATRILKGEPGSVVDVTIVPGPRPEEGPAVGEAKVVRVQRAVVRPPSVFARRVGPDGAYGVIRLTEFVDATEEDFAKALEAMRSDDIKGLVLDLRGNGGGVLPAAVAVVDRFLDRGVVVRMEGRARHANRTYEATAEKTFSKELPLVVLVDGRSASASEVVGGALQDHRRALLVGDRTYGKFLVQQIVDIPGHDAALQLTTSRYYLPSGRSYQRPREMRNGNGNGDGDRVPDALDGHAGAEGGGILPDIVVPLDADQDQQVLKSFANEEAVPWGEDAPFPEVPADWVDPQMTRALELLQGQMVLRKIRQGRRPQ